MKRRIGRSELCITPLALGGNVFGWTADRAATFRMLDAFVDAGGDMIDTADIYSCWAPGNAGGESESLIGAWLKSRRRRDRIVLATKGGLTRTDDPALFGSDLSAANIIASVEGSLRRLQTDYIDLYQTHQDDPATPCQETLAALDALMRAGKVRAVGASHFQPERLREAATDAEHGHGACYESFQTLYNLFDRTTFENELRPVCQDLGMGVLCYSALAKGFLSGRYRAREDMVASPWAGRLARYDTPRGARILAAVRKVADDMGCPPAAVALAWLLAQPAVTAPIVAVNSLAELGEVIDAPHLQLGAEALRRLCEASEPEDAS